jgi:hypothetical protein
MDDQQQTPLPQPHERGGRAHPAAPGTGAAEQVSAEESHRRRRVLGALTAA